jgi:nitroreductase/FMN reductase (NADPH)
MPEFLDVLVSRKSIRRYKPDPIPDDILDKILEAARWSPTPHNMQNFEIVIIDDRSYVFRG